MARDYTQYTRAFHSAKWDEEIIFELSVPGQRGMVVTQPDAGMIDYAGDGLDALPECMRREAPPALPEVHQSRVNRHYLRLTQEILGYDVTPDICEGTCTMKYSPKVQEHLVARNPHVVDVHPLQPAQTIQGILEIYKKTEQFVCEVSGFDAFSFHPGGGAAACYTGASVVRAYHASRGDFKRDEIITTMFSHPCDAAAPATAGFKVITLMPEESGLPSLDALKAVLSDRTAAIFITNPEDTGIYNGNIKQFVDAAHAVGALCYYDQANLNGIMGITRACDAGFDILHYNLHKTFSSPHGGMGPGCGALGVRSFLKPFLPVPRVEFDGSKYYFDFDCPQSIGKVRSFYGNIHVVIRVYMWIMQMGAEGLKEAAICSVLNNQYLMKKLSAIHGVKIYYAEGKRRLEQVRYSWQTLKEETGFGTADVVRRLGDFGFQHYFKSHHPFVVPEPFTLEPTESNSKEDLDELAATLARIARECYEQPDVIRGAPHNGPAHDLAIDEVTRFEDVASTWRQWKKRKGLA